MRGPRADQAHHGAGLGLLEQPDAGRAMNKFISDADMRNCGMEQTSYDELTLDQARAIVADMQFFPDLRVIEAGYVIDINGESSEKAGCRALRVLLEKVTRQGR